MSNLGGIYALLAIIIAEISVLFTGMTLVPVMAKSRYKRYTNAVQPTLILVGLGVLVAYIFI